MQQLFDYGSYILKPDRSEDEYIRIYGWLKRKSDILKNLSFDTMKKLVKEAEVIRCLPNQLLIRQGEAGDCFYILFSGSASIYINQDQTSSTMTSSYSEEMSKDRHNVGHSNVTGGKGKVYKYLSESDRKVLGQLVGKYKEGACFGEMALIQRDSIRNASIIIDEKSVILQISQELFDSILKSVTQALFQQKIQFTNEIFLFKSWQPRLKQQISMSFVKKSFMFGEKIVCQGDKANGILFFIKGSAKLILDFKKSSSELNIVEELYQKRKQGNEKSCLDVPDQASVGGRINSVRRILERSGSNLIEDYEVALIGTNDYIGDIEYVCGYPSSLFTYEACETCECYMLENIHLNRIFNWKKTSKSTNSLEELAFLKLKHYYERCFQVSNAPVLKVLLEIMNSQFDKIKLPSINLSGNTIETYEVTSPRKQPVFKTGPLIDIYGPGSVFYRNRMKRQKRIKKMAAIKKKNQRKYPDLPVILLDDNLTNENQDYETTNDDSGVLPGESKSKSSNDRFMKRVEKDVGSANLASLEDKINRWMSKIDVGENDSSKYKPYEITKFSRVYKKLENAMNATKKTGEDEDGEDGSLNMTMKGMPKKQKTPLDFRNMKREMLMKERKLEYLKLSLAI